MKIKIETSLASPRYSYISIQLLLSGGAAGHIDTSTEQKTAHFCSCSPLAVTVLVYSCTAAFQENCSMLVRRMIQHSYC